MAGGGGALRVLGFGGFRVPRRIPWGLGFLFMFHTVDGQNPALPIIRNIPEFP